jgi:penicillin-binding protein-related factor A (putative recombinase)
MSQKNTGKDSEDIFVQRIESLGKKAHLYRITDTFEASRGKVKVQVKSTPADYILCYNGVMAFAEVKSITGGTSFPFSKFTTSQNVAMRKQIAALGNYWIYIHKKDTDEWFKIDAYDVQEIRNERESIKWEDLRKFYKWKEIP